MTLNTLKYIDELFQAEHDRLTEKARELRKMEKARADELHLESWQHDDECDRLRKEFHELDGQVVRLNLCWNEFQNQDYR